jgi:hypothetical protein
MDDDVRRRIDDRLASVVPAHAVPDTGPLVDHLDDLCEPRMVADPVPDDLEDVSAHDGFGGKPIHGLDHPAVTC